MKTHEIKPAPFIDENEFGALAPTKSLESLAHNRPIVISACNLVWAPKADTLWNIALVQYAFALRAQNSGGLLTIEVVADAVVRRKMVGDNHGLKFGNTSKKASAI